MPVSIFIIEDEAPAAENLGSNLGALGYTVIGSAGDPEAALAALTVQRPDLVLMDVNLSQGGEWLAAAETLRSQHGLPVVYLTTSIDDTTLARAGSTHPFGFVMKPFAPRDLQVAIEIALHNHALTCRLARAEQALREHEQRQRAILDNISDPAWLKDPEGRYLAVNRAWCEFFGRPEPEIVGRTDQDLLPAALAEEFGAEDRRVIAGGQPVRVEQQIVDRVGKTHWFETCKTPLRNLDGTVSGTVGITRNITGHKQTEAALAAESVRRRILFENSPDGILIIDPQTARFLEFNTAAHTQLGYSREEFAQLSIRDVEAVETKEATKARITGVLQSGRADFETLQRTRQGDLRHVHVTAQNVDVLGQKIYYCTWRDITDRKRVERALAEQAETYRALLGTTLDGVIETDEDTRICDVNQAFCRMLGYTRMELMGMSMQAVEAVEDAEAIKRHARRIRREGSDRFESRYRTKEGRLIDVDVSVTHLRGRNRFLAFLRDITSRREMEIALRESEARFRSYVDNAPVGVLVADATGRHVDANRAAEEILGRGPGGLIGTRTADLPAPEDSAAADQHFAAVQAQGTADSEFRLLRGDGSRVWVAIRASRLPGDRFLAIIQDRSLPKALALERERLIANLDRKNHELEHLVYVTSHDLRTPMLNIQGFSTRIDDACRELARLSTNATLTAADREAIAALVTQRLPHSLQHVLTSVDKMDRLIAALLRLSRLGRAELQIETLDLNAVVTDILHIMAFSLQEAGASVEIGPLPRCWGDAGQISQLFTNLLDNALKYRRPDRALCVGITGRTDGRHAIYCVADNGVGIKAEHQENIWKVFFQANPTGSTGGDGIGLNLVRRIVERHQGEVRVESKPGEGSRFYVTLPLPPDGEPAPPDAANAG